MSGGATNTGKKISSRITNGSILIPQEWLSRRDEIKIPHERRSRKWGIFILLQLLRQEWGIWNVPWVMNEEFFPSLFLSRPRLTFSYYEGKFQQICLWYFKKKYTCCLRFKLDVPTLLIHPFIPISLHNGSYIPFLRWKLPYNLNSLKSWMNKKCILIHTRYYFLISTGLIQLES